MFDVLARNLMLTAIIIAYFCFPHFAF